MKTEQGEVQLESLSETSLVRLFSDVVLMIRLVFTGSMLYPSSTAEEEEELTSVLEML